MQIIFSEILLSPFTFEFFRRHRSCGTCVEALPRSFDLAKVLRTEVHADGLLELLCCLPLDTGRKMVVAAGSMGAMVAAGR
jgi:hypothetical protein